MKVRRAVTGWLVVFIAAWIAGAEDAGGLVPMPTGEMLSTVAGSQHAGEEIRTRERTCPEWPDYFVFDVLCLPYEESISTR